jgi:nudix-type nucleoside diphosphatase (YffH/AdpP family)
MKSVSNDRVRIRKVQTLAQDWNVLRKYTIDYRRRDGVWQRLCREACQRGDSVAVLLYSPDRGSVILTRQFRLPVLLSGHAHGMLTEVPGGLVHARVPNEAALCELEEEVGIHVDEVTEVLFACMSPAVLIERVHLFIAKFSLENRISVGGGVLEEGEDIEVHEVPFSTAFDMIARKQIIDGRTILLLYYAKLNCLLGDARTIRKSMPRRQGELK